MPVFNSESRLIGGKREAVSGDAETLTTPDFNVRMTGVELTGLEVEQSEDNKVLTGDHTQSESTAGVARASLDMSIKYAVGLFLATGTAGSPVWENKLTYGKYLEGAGLIINTTQPTDENTQNGYWSIFPNKSGDCQTLTMSLFDVSTCNEAEAKGIEYKIAGAMSTLIIESEKAGAPFRFNFSTQGKVSDVVEVDAFDLPEYDDDNILNTAAARMLNTDIVVTEVENNGSDLPAPVVVTTFESDGTTAQPTFAANGTTSVVVYDAGKKITVYDSNGDEVEVYNASQDLLIAYDGSFSTSFCSDVFSLDTGNTLAEIMCQADAYGIKQNIITGRKPMISFTPLLNTLSKWDFWAGLNEGKTYKFSLINWKDSAKTIKQLEITAPRIQMVVANGTDSNGFRRLEQQFNLLRNTQGADADEKQKDFQVKIYGETVNNTTP